MTATENNRKYISRYNIYLRKWELGYLVNGRFRVVALVKSW
jgi:hypothetical protein